jgi:mRNA interferase MazF
VIPTRYVPEAGDIVWLKSPPERGHDQAGRQAAVVLSPKTYNARAGLLVCVPVTYQIKGYPFEVALSDKATAGAALADQVKCLDWQSRQAEKKGSATPEEMAKIKAKVGALLGIG